MTTRNFSSEHNIDTWISTIEKLTQVDDILRTTFTCISGVWYGVVLKTAKIAVDVIDVNGTEERKARLDDISSSYFTFGKPFIRYALLRDTRTGFAELVVKMDHGLYDGTPLRIIGRRFAALQRGEARPSSTISRFTDYAKHIANTSQQKRDAAITYFTDPKRLPTVDATPFPNIEDPVAMSSVWVPGASPGIEAVARDTGVTIPILFQAAFQIWLTQESGTSSAGYDYLYTGRNVDIPGLDPQEINGCTANFLPVRSTPEGSMVEYLQRTQAEFWEMAAHGIVGLDDIYGTVDLDQRTHGNRTLFLFQPFEAPLAAPIGGRGHEMGRHGGIRGDYASAVRPCL
ncbi:hypothetical protein F4860DRAFT_481630 [Xylaria cubensis]|nr:hypothetical protein F4860DRAFT_481630 [Xylaria cubensis]